MTGLQDALGLVMVTPPGHLLITRKGEAKNSSQSASPGDCGVTVYCQLLQLWEDCVLSAPSRLL
jgi:hypothetical protein